MPTEVIEAETLAEKRAAKRYTLINAVLLFLNAAQRAVGHTTFAIAPPIQPQNLVILTSFENKFSVLYPSDDDPYCAFINNTLLSMNRRTALELPNRGLITSGLLKVAFDMLDSALSDDSGDSLKLAELLYLAHSRYSESDFDNSLVLAWAACEKMLTHRWSHFIENNRAFTGGGARINKKRKKHLNTSEFTASIISEFLELSGYLDKELLDRLNKARKARNDWMHYLTPATNDAAINALQAASIFYRLNTGIQIDPTLSRVAPGTGGVPPDMYEIQA